MPTTFGKETLDLEDMVLLNDKCSASNSYVFSVLNQYEVPQNEWKWDNRRSMMMVHFDVQEKRPEDET